MPAVWNSGLLLLQQSGILGRHSTLAHAVDPAWLLDTLCSPVFILPPSFLLLLLMVPICDPQPGNSNSTSLYSPQELAVASFIYPIILNWGTRFAQHHLGSSMICSLLGGSQILGPVFSIWAHRSTKLTHDRNSDQCLSSGSDNIAVQK